MSPASTDRAVAPPLVAEPMFKGIDRMKTFLCATSDVPDGTTASVRTADAEEFAVCHVDGRFYVLDALCSHGNASLAEGRLRGCEIECPLHAGRFDIRSGRATRRPAKRPVAVHECVVEDGRLYLIAPADAHAGDAAPEGGHDPRMSDRETVAGLRR